MLSLFSVTQFAVAWQRLRQLQEEDATLEASVMSVNRGGLLVEAASLRGFIPTSHVSVVRVLAQPCDYISGSAMLDIVHSVARTGRMLSGCLEQAAFCDWQRTSRCTCCAWQMRTSIGYA